MVLVGHPHGNVVPWTVGVHGTAFVEECVDSSTVGNDDNGGRADLEGENRPILACPFLKPRGEDSKTVHAGFLGHMRTFWQGRSSGLDARCPTPARWVAQEANVGPSSQSARSCRELM
jgi:hypothetical protein